MRAPSPDADSAQHPRPRADIDIAPDMGGRVLGQLAQRHLIMQSGSTTAGHGSPSPTMRPLVPSTRSGAAPAPADDGILRRHAQSAGQAVKFGQGNGDLHSVSVIAAGRAAWSRPQSEPGRSIPAPCSPAPHQGTPSRRSIVEIHRTHQHKTQHEDQPDDGQRRPPQRSAQQPQHEA